MSIMTSKGEMSGKKFFGGSRSDVSSDSEFERSPVGQRIMSWDRRVTAESSVPSAEAGSKVVMKGDTKGIRIQAGEETMAGVKMAQASGRIWDHRKKRAWLGDTVHRLDIQIALILSGVDDSDLESQVQRYCSGEAQALYWLGLLDVSELCVPSGNSDHSISTAFECSYKGDFRIEYLQKRFPKCWEEILSRVKPPDLGGHLIYP